MTKRFSQATEDKRDLFIPFIMAGDPCIEATIDIALALQESGASILELGIPYSDPLADGPVIQEAAKRALSEGMTLEKAMDLVPIMRERGLTIPVIIFTYYNPLLQYGEERFIETALKNEIDGLLVPDLPYEESEKVSSLCKKVGLKFITLVAPTSEQRIEKLATQAQGFLYCVSSLGVTGTRSEFATNVFDFLGEVKKHSNVPVAVGFGVSSNKQVKELKGHCDGIIVGSAIIKEIEKVSDQLKNENSRKNAIDQIKRFVLSLVSS